jgi:pilus assembly protein Flp/PilA
MQLAKLIRKVVVGEEGVSMIEYGLLAALIAVVCVAIIGSIGTDLLAKFQAVDTNLK